MRASQTKDMIGKCAAVLLGMLGILCIFLLGRHYYEAHVSSFTEEARPQFFRVLELELVKRKDKAQRVCSNREGEVMSKREMVKDTVIFIRSGAGERKYAIPLHRRENNIEMIPEYRMTQSGILYEYPLEADTVLKAWQKSLTASDFRLSVRVGVTDFSEKETFSYAGDTACLADADSLFSYYIGMRSEVEITGFAHGVWYRMLTAEQWAILASLFVFTLGITMCICCFRVVGNRCRACLHRVFPLQAFSDDAAGVSNEAPSSPLRVLGLKFHPDSLLLEGNKGSRKLPPQQASLFLTFANAAEYRLSKAEITTLLWPDGNFNDHSLHAAISRLRKELRSCGDVGILDLNAVYQLRKSINEEFIF